jgi:cytochrome P450
LAGFEDAEEFEVVGELAEPLQIQTVGRLMGMPEADRPRIRDWTHQSTEACLGENRGTIEAQQTLLGMLREFSEYFVGTIAERRANRPVT